MLVSTNISFMVFSLPYSILNNEKFKQNNDVSIIANMLSYSNNSFNFIFYYLFSTGYRVRLKEIFESIFHYKFNNSQCCTNHRLSEYTSNYKNRYTNRNESTLITRQTSIVRSNFHKRHASRNQITFNNREQTTRIRSGEFNSTIHHIEIVEN